MKILCFLQNMWVKDPEKTRAFLEKHPELRERTIKALLFMGCLTGRRIKAAFGQDLVDSMIFEEASREIAGDSRTICPPDPEHIKACLDEHGPHIVITFGKIAEDAVLPLWTDWHDRIWMQWEKFQNQTIKEPIFIACPHPAARQADTVEKLKAAADKIRRFAGKEVAT